MGPTAAAAAQARARCGRKRVVSPFAMRALAPRAALALPAVGGPRACASALRALRLFEW